MHITFNQEMLACGICSLLTSLGASKSAFIHKPYYTLATAMTSIGTEPLLYARSTADCLYVVKSHTHTHTHAHSHTHTHTQTCTRTKTLARTYKQNACRNRNDHINTQVTETLTHTHRPLQHMWVVGLGISSSCSWRGCCSYLPQSPLPTRT